MQPRRFEQLNITVRSEEGGTFIAVDGRVTVDSSPTLRERVLAILYRESLPVLTIDLTAVPYIDTSGLATLVEALKVARAGNTSLRLRLNNRPRYLLEVTGLLHLFEAPADVTAGSASKDNSC